jgi:hypothetical protein
MREFKRLEKGSLDSLRDLVSLLGGAKVREKDYKFVAA